MRRLSLHCRGDQPCS